MVLGKTIRLSKLTREFNVGIHTIVEFLHKKGYDYDSNPNTKVSEEAVALLEKEYKIDLNLKKESEKIILKSHRPKQEVISIDDKEEEEVEDEDDYEEEEPKAIPKKTPPPVTKKKEQEEAPVEKPKYEDRIKIVGKVDLENVNKPAKKEVKPVEEKIEKEPQKEEVPKAEEKPSEPEKPDEKEIKEEKKKKKFSPYNLLRKKKKKKLKK